MVSTLAECLSLDFHPHSIHARPDAQRHHGHRSAAGRSRDRRAAVALRARAGLRQRAAGRRDQPHAAQDAGRAARGHAGAASFGRRPPPSRCPIRSSCWPRKTRSSRKGPIRCPRRSSTASCSRSSSAIRRPTKSGRSIAVTTGVEQHELTKVLDGEEIPELQALVRRVPVSDHCLDYAMALVRATRTAEERQAGLHRQVDRLGRRSARRAGADAGGQGPRGARRPHVRDDRRHSRRGATPCCGTAW